MAEKKTAARKQKAGEGRHSPLYDATRRVLLAGVGAVILAQDEVERFVDELAERGELVESEARSMVNEIMDKRDSFIDRIRTSPGNSTDAASKEDIEELKQKIAELSAKLDAVESEKK